MKIYKGLDITPKRDFGTVGYLINGKYIKRGWLVCYKFCNIVDGAMWFLTVRQAKKYIDDNFEKLSLVAKQVEAM